MEEQTQKKSGPCCCAALMGALVIVFAWWKVGWGAIALTVLGTLIVIKELVNCCCCKGKICKT